MKNLLKKITGIVLGFMLLASLAFAGPLWETGSVVAKVGTLGGGLEYIHPVHDKINVGIGVNYFTHDLDKEFDDVAYEAELDIFSVSLLGHFHPWPNGFRLSAGVLYNGNELSVDARPTGGSYEFGGVNFDARDVGTANGSIDFNSFAPYVGIGWGNAT